MIDCKPDDSAPLYDGSYQSSSQLDPSNPATFTLIENLVEELVEIFPDEYIHFGGDEVQVPCYNSSEKIRAFMGTKGWSTTCPKLKLDPEDLGAGSGSGSHCPGYKHLIAYFIRTIYRLCNPSPSVCLLVLRPIMTSYALSGVGTS